MATPIPSTWAWLGGGRVESQTGNPARLTTGKSPAVACSAGSLAILVIFKLSDSTSRKEIGSGCKLPGSIMAGPFFLGLFQVLVLPLDVGWKSWTTSLPPFWEGIAVDHHLRPE